MLNRLHRVPNANQRGFLTLLAILLLIALAGPAAADPGHGTFPTAGSSQQREITDLYVLVGWMSIVISILVLGALVYIIAKYRTSHDDESEGNWFTHNNTLEITWTVVTAIVLIYLGVVTAQAMDRMGAATPLEDNEERIDIAVIGHQWYWQFVYPDGNTTSETLHIEANRTVRFHVASCDVIHAFYVPNLGVKLDTSVVGDDACKALQNAKVPDRPRINSVQLKAEPGTYELQCAEFCGAAHAFMNGDIVAFEPGTREKPYGPPQDKGAVKHLEIAEQDGNVTLAPDTLAFTTGDLTTWIVHNNGTTPHELALPAPLDRTTGSIAPGETAELRFTANTAGSWNITVDEQPVGTLDVGAGEVVHVELNDSPWYVRDGNQFEPGGTYSIKVWNNGSMPHNLYIGTFTQNREDRTAIFKTETYPAGEFRWLNVTMPGEDVTLEWWCDVPGHASAGMLDEIQVGEGGTEGSGSTEQANLIPTVGAATILLVLLGAAIVGARRRR